MSCGKNKKRGLTLLKLQMGFATIPIVPGLTTHCSN